MSIKRQLRIDAQAKRIYSLRRLGMTISEVAKECDVPRDRVRTLELLGERIMQVGR